MARCAGCSGEGCFCNLQVLDTETVNMFLTGNGSTETPWTISATAEGGGGGGDCQQKNLYTVATVGPAGLGLDLSTQEPFLSCADFIGDGVNDDVAINAACTAAVGTLLFDIYPEVYINSGIFFTSDTIDAQGITLRGSSKTIIGNGLTDTGFPLLVDPGVLTDLTIGNLFSASNEAVVQLNTSQNVLFERVTFLSGGIGAASGVIEFNASGNVTIQDCSITGPGTADTTAAGIFFFTDFAGRVYILGNNLIACSIDLTGVGWGSQIKNNSIQSGGLDPVTDKGSINLTHPGTNVVISNWQINDNIISSARGHGISVNGGSNPNGEYAWAQIHNNLIYDWGNEGTAMSYDGIFLEGRVLEISIQGNKCLVVPAGADGARHGINISEAACTDNLVTNNDLFNSGDGTSLNNAGTNTITAAGNRL